MKGGARQGAGRYERRIQLDAETAKELRWIRDQWRGQWAHVPNSPYAHTDAAGVVAELIQREARRLELEARIRAHERPAGS